jgi:hypothetical protein
LVVVVTSATGVARTVVVAAPPPALVRLCDRDEDGRLGLELPPPLPLLPPPPVVGDDGVEVWVGAVAAWPVGGFPPVTGGVTVGGVTGVVTGGSV